MEAVEKCGTTKNKPLLLIRFHHSYSYTVYFTTKHDTDIINLLLCFLQMLKDTDETSIGHTKREKTHFHYPSIFHWTVHISLLCCLCCLVPNETARQQARAALFFVLDGKTLLETESPASGGLVK